MIRRSIVFAALLPLAAVSVATAEPIDREALVRRHAIAIAKADPHAPVMLGNGELGFTADITGLQTFPALYSELAPLLTMAQWGWHSFPNPKGYTERDGLTMVPVPGRGDQPYPWMRAWSDAETNPAFTWLRANPHRVSLGRIALSVGGRPADIARITDTRQTLDMWTGTLTSRFRYDGQPVEVRTRVLPGVDAVAVEVTSPLVARGALGVSVAWPGVAPAINPDPSNWTPRAGEATRVLAHAPGEWRIERRLDATRYWSTVRSDGRIAQAADGRLTVHGKAATLHTVVAFSQQSTAIRLPRFAAMPAAVAAHWRRFWTSGAAVDFTGSSDPRAAELERRVVLSQYLSAINGSGTLPPQEEGLFSNSWFGKFHLEMHPWHSGWQAAWGHPELLERSMGWYLRTLPSARAEAARHRVKGAWWPKMVGPGGRNSPSLISPFIMWQQPHPILLAELIRRAGRDHAAIDRYAPLVEATAEVLASWPTCDAAVCHLGPPLIPAQENYDPLTTRDPVFELEYFRWALGVAQEWRTRRGLPRRADWDGVIARLAAPPKRDGLYLPVASVPDFWRVAMSDRCRRHAEPDGCRNRDHPSFLMAYGFIPGTRIDRATMGRTLQAVEANWDMRQTWGWDYPMIAMTAARLGQPDKAVDWLFAPGRNNQWGPTGMTPRVHLDAHAEGLVPKSGGAGGVAMAKNPDGPGYARAAETYFPSNGALLMAVGLMAGGWDGADRPAPGFPQRGWRVRAEGFTPLP
ncbi:hypothetical protein [Sphingomonas insulae]|uniref:Uncharacterized protein n=1 Tax=Sphingomonas insulae TaxID=424800 RepID=A0ABP3SY42_9SPHN|nr:hypothetical protein [Sphingomonas insulae]